jgi:hypothetical protein
MNIEPPIAKREEHVRFNSKVHIIVDDDERISHISVDIIEESVSERQKEDQEKDSKTNSFAGLKVSLLKSKIFSKLFQTSIKKHHESESG